MPANFSDSVWSRNSIAQGRQVSVCNSKRALAKPTFQSFIWVLFLFQMAKAFFLTLRIIFMKVRVFYWNERTFLKLQQSQALNIVNRQSGIYIKTYANIPSTPANLCSLGTNNPQIFMAASNLAWESNDSRSTFAFIFVMMNTISRIVLGYQGYPSFVLNLINVLSSLFC